MNNNAQEGYVKGKPVKQQVVFNYFEEEKSITFVASLQNG